MMEGESHEDAAMRAVQPVIDAIRDEALRVQDRLVIERLVARDEDGRRREPQIDDAALREALGLF